MTSMSVTDMSQLGISEPRYSKDNDDVPEHTVIRERFVSKWNSLFSFIGFLVGPGNVWRFPYLVLKNGGAIFVLVYLAAVFTIAMPLTFMEFGLGQFSGMDVVKVWDINPAFRGLGFSMVLVSLMATCIIHMFMAYCVLYAYNGIRYSTPWGRCELKWQSCVENYNVWVNMTKCKKVSKEDKYCWYPAAANYYYRFHTLGIDPEDDSFGTPSVPLSIILVFSWGLVVLLTYRGVRTTCKLIYISVILPYIAILVLLFTLSTKEGAEQGMQYLFTSYQWDKLLDINTWVDGVAQALFSLSTCTGTLFMLGSYRHFETSPRRDIIVVTVVDTLTSLLVVIVIFQSLYHAFSVANHDYTVEKLVKPDNGMFFVVFSAILADSKFSHVWALFFFSLMYMLAMDTEFGFVETIMGYLQDDFRIVRRHTSKFRIMLVVFCLSVNIALTCPGGHKVVMQIDKFGIGVTLPIIAFLEIIVISWGYGIRKWLEDMEYMLGFKLSHLYFIIFLYAVLVPISLMLIVLTSAIKANDMGSKNSVGAVLVILVLTPVPVWFGLHLYAICRRKRTRKLTCKRFITRIMKPSRRWVANDGSNVKRQVDTVFADIFRRLRTRRLKTSPKQYQDEFGKQVDDFYGRDPPEQLTALSHLDNLSKNLSVKFSNSLSKITTVGLSKSSPAAQPEEEKEKGKVNTPPADDK